MLSFFKLNKMELDRRLMISNTAINMNAPMLVERITECD